MSYNAKNYTEQGGEKTVIGGTLEIKQGASVTGLPSDFTPAANQTDSSATTTVRFLDWDEDVLKSELVEHGYPATPPETPIRAGYRFVGWDSPGTEILSDLDIHALYEQIVYYTVRFLDWNDTVLKTEVVEQGGTATPPANPTRSGYTFTGWLPSVFTNINADTDFASQYQIVIVYHTVRFYSDGTLLDTMQVEDGEAAIMGQNRAAFIVTLWHDARFTLCFYTE